MTEETPPKEIISYKAFDAELKCNNFQFKVGQTYEHKGAVQICSSGFHACEDPLDVLKYKPLIEDGKIARFARVIQSGETQSQNDKVCSAKIYIAAELKLPEFIAEIFNGKWFKDLIKLGGDTAASGYGSQLAASGDDSKLAASGDDSKLAASGYGSKLAASGYGSQLAASGDDSKLAASGYGSQLAASGNYSQLAASGDDSKLAASGYGSQLAIDGNRGVVASAERDCMAKGPKGTLICLTHYKEKDGKHVPVKFVTGKIGEKGLRANTWYKLNKEGKLVTHREKKDG